MVPGAKVLGSGRTGIVVAVVFGSLSRQSGRDGDEQKVIAWGFYRGTV